jgi:dTDP-4-amino-4,6-dideoxygalactose transaminase
MALGLFDLWKEEEGALAAHSRATAVAAGKDHIAFARTVICEEAIAAAVRVLNSGWVTTGPEVVNFEQEFSEMVGAEEAVAVSSCTAAIEIALRSLRLRPGSPVLTSTLTFCGAVHAIVHAGLRPVLVDVDPDTLMPTPQTVATARERAGGAEAMVVIHFAGHPAAVEDLALAAALPLGRVVEDAAHALGTHVGDRPVGSTSAATCFSFYATKNLPIGEGGMITGSDPELAERWRILRLHGMSRDAWKRYLPGASWRYAVTEDGLKANMTDLSAAIGRAQLHHLDRWQRRREILASLYHLHLQGVQGVRCPPIPNAGRHAWHLYVIRVSCDRDTLIERLAQLGIDCSVHFIPIHRFPYFRQLLGEPQCESVPVADAEWERIVSLPLHCELDDDSVRRICEVLADLVPVEAGAEGL